MQTAVITVSVSFAIPMLHSAVNGVQATIDTTIAMPIQAVASAENAVQSRQRRKKCH